MYEEHYLYLYSLGFDIYFTSVRLLSPNFRGATLTNAFLMGPHSAVVVVLDQT